MSIPHEPLRLTHESCYVSSIKLFGGEGEGFAALEVESLYTSFPHITIHSSRINSVTHKFIAYDSTYLRELLASE